MSSDASSSRVVIFRIGADLYGVDVQGVERVARYQTPRVLPRLPEWIEGVIELEGRLIPVVDLRRRLTATTMDVGAQTRLLIVTMEHDWCAMIVDQVLDVRVYTLSGLDLDQHAFWEFQLHLKLILGLVPEELH